MRLRHWWRRLVLSTSMLACCNVPAMADPIPQHYPDTASSQNYSRDAEIDLLQRQLQLQSQKLNDLTELIRQQNARTEANFANFSQKEAAKAKEEANPFEEIETISKPTFKIHGRMYLDHIMYDDAPGLGVDRMNETGFDTARIGATGYAYENVKYKIEVEFEGTEVDYKDVYIQLDNVCQLGHVRVGHFKEPWSLEEQTSSRFVTFMERSGATNAFSPQRNFGVMVFNTVNDNPNLGWYAGTFRGDFDDSPTGSGSIKQDAGDWTATGRVCWLPYFDENSPGRYLVHFGGAASYRESGSAKGFRIPAELGTQGSYIADSFVDMDWFQTGVEMAVNWGPASLQSEFYRADIQGQDVNGGYVQVTYFLTGENRGYKRSGHKFDRVKPYEDAFWVSTSEGCCRGIGAWELKARWSYVDLNAGTGATRGYGDNLATGFNWYLNPYTRFMFDYVYEDINRAVGAVGQAHNFGMRFQIDF